MSNTNPNSLKAALNNCKRFWTEPELREKNIAGRKSARFRDSHTTEHLQAESVREKCTAAKRASAKFRETVIKNTANLHTPEARAKIAETRKTSEACAEATKRMLAAARESPLCKAGVDNHAAKMWYLRSPENRTFTFKNLNEFLRQNRHLFSAEYTDRIIYRGLSMLRPSPGKKKVPGSWYGWTWNSYTEQMLNMGEDILKRNIVE